MSHAISAATARRRVKTIFNQFNRDSQEAYNIDPQEHLQSTTLPVMYGGHTLNERIVFGPAGKVICAWSDELKEWVRPDE